MILELKNVDVFYGNIQALKQVSLGMTVGEIIALIGGNGAGKSTLLKAISGLVSKNSGEITFDGKSITHKAVAEIINLGIAVVPEGRRLFGALSVLDNLKLGAFLRLKNGRRQEVHRDLVEVFTLFPRLRERQRQSAGTLSGGEQQMLAIARSLMSKPRMILMDEVSLGLMPLYVEETFNVIRKLHEQGVTILLVEQNARKALQAADRGYVLETGEIVMSDTSGNLAADPMIRKAYLGA